MRQHSHVIKNVLPGSIAREMEICAGDKLLLVNGKPVEDIFDYRFFIDDDYVELTIESADGEICVYEIEKDYDEDIGLEFESGLMDDYHSCTNKCIFCFIDQMPPGMRETLYFKDDDSRLSFLQGNYVTLTNMKKKDIDRIIAYHMEPINISVHTTDRDLRFRMLNNRFAGEVLDYIDVLYESGIGMNGQIVLCKGVNDGIQLEKTISDLSKYLPYMASVSVVPVGLTRYRDGLYDLEPFSKSDAEEVIECVEKWQKKMYNIHGLHFIHASDEFYLLADREVPEEERYDGYMQIENGVGMIRALKEEFMAALETFVAALGQCYGDNDMGAGKHTSASDQLYDNRINQSAARRITIATGKLAAPLIEELAEMLTVRLSGLKTADCACLEDHSENVNFDDLVINAAAISNEFFGERITVSGLITGQDIIAQLKGRDLGDELLLPVNMFRSGEEVFLDDVTRTEVEEALGVKVLVVPASGQALLEAMLGLMPGGLLKISEDLNDAVQRPQDFDQERSAIDDQESSDSTPGDSANTFHRQIYEPDTAFLRQHDDK